MSHASTDDGIVTRIDVAVAKAGITIRVDNDYGITPDDNFNAAIQEDVNSSKYGLLVHGRRAVIGGRRGGVGGGRSRRSIAGLMLQCETRTITSLFVDPIP